MSKHEIKFLLDGFPRSGSTSIARMLNEHPDIRCCLEPFHPQKFGGSYNSLSITAGSVSPALKLLGLRWSGLKHVWEPGTGWPFVGHMELNTSLVAAAGIIVTIRRRNLLRQCVSNCLSRQLGFWVGEKKEFAKRLSNTHITPLNLNVMRKMLADAVGAEKSRDQILASLSSKKITLCYEEVFSETNSLTDKTLFCHWLIDFLEYPPLDSSYITEHCLPFLDAGRFKWSGAHVYARIPGIREIDKELGSERTGFVFEP